MITPRSERASRSTAAMADWPLVGRQEELGFITTLTTRADVSGVVLAGAAGVGKSRLAREALLTLGGQGMATAAVSGCCRDIGLGAFADLLPLASRAVEPLALSRRLVERLDSPGSRPVLVVDEGHLLDDASAAVVHVLGSTRWAFLVVTVRSGEETPDSIKALWREGVCERLEVQPLSRRDVGDLAEQVLGDPVEDATIRRLWNVCRGNVCYLRELVLSGLQAGSLVRADGIWAWRGPLVPRARLHDVVMANIGSLDPEERAALETMAFAEPIGPEPLAGLVSADALERLERRAVLEAERDVERLCLRLSHPLYGAVLRADTPVLPRRRIQQSLAGALEAAGARRREDPLRIATWRLAGAGHRDSRALTRAALEAIAALRFGVAERLARAAVRAGGGVAASLALGESLVRQGRSQEAEVVLSPLLPEATSDAQRAQAITLHARNLFFGKSDPAAARCLLDGDSVVDRDARDRLACEDAALLLYAGKACEALRAAEAARERAVRAETRLAATLVAAPAAALCGSTGRSLQLVEEGLSGPAISQESRAQLLLSKFTALWLAGELSQAETTADALSTFAVGQEAPDGLALVAGPLGLVALWQGRLATAIARLREAAAELRRCDPYHCLPGYLAQLAYALALVGDLAAGERVLTEAQAARHDAVRLYEAEVAVAQAWLIAGHGEISAACSILADAASVASAGGLRVFEAVALHDAARLGRAEPVAHRLRVLATHTDSDLVSLFASHATALADRDAGSLEHVAAAFEFLGATLLAAEAAAEAAATYRRKGQAGKAAAVSARSLQLGARCQGARPPALALAGESALLTPREREIARLAAEGLPSHAIAKRLVLSTRTVDNHLHHIFIKTGVAGRHELAAVLGERLAAEGSESRVGLSRRQR